MTEKKTSSMTRNRLAYGKQEQLDYIQYCLLQETGVTYKREELDKIIKAYQRMIIDVLSYGDSFRMGNLGKFVLCVREKRKEMTFTNPKTREKIIVPPLEAHNVPRFKFSPSVKAEFRAKTLGHPLREGSLSNNGKKIDIGGTL